MKTLATILSDRPMPELPDIVVYVRRLNAFYAGKTLRKIDLKSPFVLRTFEPDVFSLEGRTITSFQRHSKRIIWEFEGNLWLVFHLMITGRFHRKKSGTKPKSKQDLAAFQFDDDTLMLTEAGKKHRAAIYCFNNPKDIEALDRGGIEPLECSPEEFAAQLKSENHTVKRSLTDPRLFSGIGNAYSDEILHAARLSPIKWTSRLTDDEVTRLHEAVVATLERWTELLEEQLGDGFPEKVTAFHPEMSVHGRFGEPCPECSSPVQRIIYAENETNYCAKCQTEGKVLADRSLSRLLKDDWPRTLE